MKWTGTLNWLLLWVITSNSILTGEGRWSPVSRQFIKKINSLATTWEAGSNFDSDTTVSYLSSLMGVHKEAHRFRLPPKTEVEESNYYEYEDYPEYFTVEEIPKFFDARDRWPLCPTIKAVSYQGSCGSSWAIAPADVMSDRYCIHSDQTKQFRFSADDLINCCHTCGFGCFRGFPGEAWSYWKKKGLCSGCPYGSHIGCRPRDSQPCNYNDNGMYQMCGPSINVTPSCARECQSSYKLSYQSDKKFGRTVYSVSKDVGQIQREIMTNGPVQAILNVHEDFLNYKWGVYRRVYGQLLGMQAVRIIGWGVDGETAYWLVANSWGDEWGAKGFFKILRGKNHCGIEEDASAGLPHCE